jgi:hypothetical protein
MPHGALRVCGDAYSSARLRYSAMDKPLKYYKYRYIRKN